MRAPAMDTAPPITSPRSSTSCHRDRIRIRVHAEGGTAYEIVGRSLYFAPYLSVNVDAPKVREQDKVAAVRRVYSTEIQAFRLRS